MNGILDPTNSSLSFAFYHAQKMSKVLNPLSLLSARSLSAIYPHCYTHFLGMTFDYDEGYLYRRLKKYVLIITAFPNEPDAKNSEAI